MRGLGHVSHFDSHSHSAAGHVFLILSIPFPVLLWCKWSCRSLWFFLEKRIFIMCQWFCPSAIIDPASWRFVASAGIGRTQNRAANDFCFRQLYVLLWRALLWKIIGQFDESASSYSGIYIIAGPAVFVLLTPWAKSSLVVFLMKFLALLSASVTHF